MAHIHELYDFTASAFIVHKDQVLLLHHKKLKTWIQPGGHIELNEDPEMALWREIEEETSLSKEVLTIIDTQKVVLPVQNNATMKSIPMPFDINVHNYDDAGQHKHIDLCYLMTSNTDIIEQNITESNDIKWFSRSQIEKMKAEMLPDVYTRALFVLDVVKKL